MKAFAKFFFSSIGSKFVMAITGFLLFVFVLGHMAGNLQVFAGPDKLNSYAFFLQSQQALLWTARASLFVLLLLHVYSSTRLTLNNQTARGSRYAKRGVVQATLASRNMYLTGAMIFFFVAYHLGQFTLGNLYPDLYHQTDALGRHDVHAMVVTSFQNWFISGSYIIAMALLALHLSHGVSSMFQSVGLNRPRYNGFVNAIGPLAAILIFLGNISMPVAALLRLVEP